MNCEPTTVNGYRLWYKIMKAKFLISHFSFLISPFRERLRKLIYLTASLISVIIAGFFICSYALTPEEVIKLKKAGVSDKTIRIMSQLEEENRFERFGVREEKDKEGNTCIIYSTGRPSKSTAADEEREKAWKMLQHIIIDRR